MFCFELSQEIADYQKRKKMIDTEVAAMFRTNHLSGFIRIYGVIQMDNGFYYLVLEKGLFNLKQLANNLPTHFQLLVPEHLFDTMANGQKVPSMNFVVNIFIDILKSLEAIHAFDGVHRDIKPENVLIMPDMSCKIGDMGLMKSAGIGGMTMGASSFSSATAAAGTNASVVISPAVIEALRSLMGTPRYMGTEQFEQCTSGQKIQYTPASDLYAAGLSLRETITRMTPFPMSDLAELAAAKARDDEGNVIVDDVYNKPGNENCINAMCGLIRKLTSKDIGARGTAAEAVVCLENIILSLGGDQRPCKLQPQVNNFHLFIYLLYIYIYYFYM